MIEAISLTKNYAKTKALNDLSFCVRKGSITGLLGPNGAGKTTTMRIICGALKPDLGIVKVNGISVGQNPVYVKSIIGYLPEVPPLYPELKVCEQLIYSARLKGVKHVHIRDRVEDVLRKCNLKDVKDKTIKNLSKGFRQRAGLAQAMINEPEVLILDEPTIGLDPAQVIEIRELIRSMSKERTVILSSHILSEIQMICDDIIILNKGSLVMSGPCKDIVRGDISKTTYDITVMNMNDKTASRVSSIKGVLSCKRLNENVMRVETTGEDGIGATISRTIVEGGCDLIEIKTGSLNLEDVFMRLTSPRGDE